MSDTNFLVEPMSAFFAAVTAVENGKVEEIELEFRRTWENAEISLLISVRKQIKPMTMYAAVSEKENIKDEDSND